MSVVVDDGMLEDTEASDCLQEFSEFHQLVVVIDPVILSNFVRHRFRFVAVVLGCREDLAYILLAYGMMTRSISNNAVSLPVITEGM